MCLTKGVTRWYIWTSNGDGLAFTPGRLVDQIYCTRVNRVALKEKGVKLLAKLLGRPSAVQFYVSPGERNPIEGKFGQAKTGYGLNRIRARLKGTSETWIASTFLVLKPGQTGRVGTPVPVHAICWKFFSKQYVVGKVESDSVGFLSIMVMFLPQIQKPHQVEMKMVA